MKPWYKSKTIWFNIVMLSLAGLETSFQLLQDVLPVASYKLWLFLITFTNVVLRAVTSQGLCRGKQQ